MIYQNQKIEIVPIYQLENLQIQQSIIIQPINITVSYKGVTYVFYFNLINYSKQCEKLILQSVKQGDENFHIINNQIYKLKVSDEIQAITSNMINKYLLDK